MDTEQVKKLAHLARINVPEADLEKIKGDLGSILEYVALLQEADIAEQHSASYATNVFREDTNPIESGAHTDEILADAPAIQDGYIKVPKIL